MSLLPSVLTGVPVVSSSDDTVFDLVMSLSAFGLEILVSSEVALHPAPAVCVPFCVEPDTSEGSAVVSTCSTCISQLVGKFDFDSLSCAGCVLERGGSDSLAASRRVLDVSTELSRLEVLALKFGKLGNEADLVGGL